MSIERHRSLHKKLRTTPWKEVVRARCVQRMMANRSQLVDKFRGLWSNREQGTSMTDAEIDQFLGIMEKMKLELRQEEEEKLLEEYFDKTRPEFNFGVMEGMESGLGQQEKLLEECFAEEEPKEDEVTCPVCKKHVLRQERTEVSCVCGLRLESSVDGLTNLKDELTSGLTNHDKGGCVHLPTFSCIPISPSSDITNLIITCSGCEFMYIVI